MMTTLTVILFCFSSGFAITCVHLPFISIWSKCVLRIVPAAAAGCGDAGGRADVSPARRQWYLSWPRDWMSVTPRRYFTTPTTAPRRGLVAGERTVWRPLTSPSPPPRLEAVTLPASTTSMWPSAATERWPARSRVGASPVLNPGGKPELWILTWNLSQKRTESVRFIANFRPELETNVQRRK